MRIKISFESSDEDERDFDRRWFVAKAENKSLNIESSNVKDESLKAQLYYFVEDFLEDFWKEVTK